MIYLHKIDPDNKIKKVKNSISKTVFLFIFNSKKIQVRLPHCGTSSQVQDIIVRGEDPAPATPCITKQLPGCTQIDPSILSTAVAGALLAPPTKAPIT